MRYLILLSIFFTSSIVLAQGKYDANWCFGNNLGIDFRDTSGLRVFSTVTSSFEANASISDAAGNLLFYLSSDNRTYPFCIRDNQDNIIKNGDSILLRDTYTNGLVILPFTNDTNKWFVFHLKGFLLDDRTIAYTTVSRYNSILKVDSKNTLLSNSYLEERMALTKHANGKDWWLLVHQSFTDTAIQSSNRYYRFLIKNDSILGPFSQDIGTLHQSQFSNVGEMIFSSDGEKLISTLGNQNSVNLFDFNRCTGELSNFVSLDNVGSGGILYGCELSKNKSKLYITEIPYTVGSNSLYQFDLSASDITTSKLILLHDTLNTFHTGQLQIAPNNKIYIASGNLGVIENPDSLGTLCNYHPYAFSFDSTIQTSYGLPNMPNYNLGPTSIYAASAGRDTVWCRDSTAGISIGSPAVANLIYHWQPAEGLNNPTIAQPVATPNSSTYYMLTVTDTSQNGGGSCTSRSDTVFVRVEACTGIAETDMSTVKVYPNPANSTITVEASVGPKSTFTLYDLVGHPVLETSLKDAKTAIDISFLPQGFYFYRTGALSGKVQVVR